MKAHIPDLIATLGLGLLACGLWKISQPLALCVVGGVLMAFGLLVAWRNTRSTSVDDFREARENRMNHAG
ncbi:hypothetical protein [Microbulbifer sp. 2205BS26-8]|uniref:hypothetical protein n=1 Tax=Microbulbifer sp. 2205BS26-8 TaxID=3064386 RepID=UPI00273E4A4A|nr:hypothetical protein [Microbulbifer sp. 2205BS26-8]MDP5211061.1 hypothetical protein [Microbulbifer sp. 2205BS26-8]